MCCWRTPSTAVTEASVIRQVEAIDKREALARASFVALKAAVAVSFQRRGCALVKGVKRLHEVSTKRQKLMVKIHQANEHFQLTLRLWLGEVSNGLDFLWKGGDTIALNVPMGRGNAA